MSPNEIGVALRLHNLIEKGPASIADATLWIGNSRYNAVDFCAVHGNVMRFVPLALEVALRLCAADFHLIEALD